MTLRTTLLLSLAAAVILPGCQHSGLRGNHPLDQHGFPLSQPAKQMLKAAEALPKDRHTMPIYPFRARKRLVRTTAYTCSESDHRRYGSKSAAGTPLLYGNRVRSAAADWSFYPVGTTFRIKGLPQLYVVDDYGSALTGTGSVDLYKPDKAVMSQWGLRHVELTIVEWGSLTRSVELLRKRQRHRHCRLMLNNILRMQPELKELALQ